MKLFGPARFSSAGFINGKSFNDFHKNSARRSGGNKSSHERAFVSQRSRNGVIMSNNISSYNEIPSLIGFMTLRVVLGVIVWDTKSKKTSPGKNIVELPDFPVRNFTGECLLINLIIS